MTYAAGPYGGAPYAGPDATASTGLTPGGIDVGRATETDVAVAIPLIEGPGTQAVATGRATGLSSARPIEVHVATPQSIGVGRAASGSSEAYSAQPLPALRKTAGRASSVESALPVLLDTSAHPLVGRATDGGSIAQPIRPRYPWVLPVGRARERDAARGARQTWPASVPIGRAIERSDAIIATPYIPAAGPTTTYPELINGHPPKLWFRWDSNTSNNEGTVGTAATTFQYSGAFPTYGAGLIPNDANHSAKIDLATTGGTEIRWYSSDGANHSDGTGGGVMEVLFSRTAAEGSASWTYAPIYQWLNRYEIRFQADGSLQFADLTGTGTTYPITTGLNDGRTHMLTVVRQPYVSGDPTANFDIYVDGALATSITNPWYANWSQMYFGSNRYGSIVTLDESQVYEGDDLVEFTAEKIANRWATLVPVAGPPQPVTIGRATESSLARALLNAMGRTFETDVAFPVGVVSILRGQYDNRYGGRSRSGLATAAWEPPVIHAAPDAGTMAYEVASAFSTPTFPGSDFAPQYDVSTARKVRHLDRIVVGGKDVTTWRGIRTPTPSYQLIEPMMYGPGALALPQVSAVFERPGIGHLKFMRKGARVLVQRVDPDTGRVTATDYRGFVSAFRVSGSELVLELGGEMSGRAALRNRQVPIFKARHDAGWFAWGAARALGMPFEPRLGPDTGIEVEVFGGMSYSDYVNQLCAMSVKRDGTMYSLMPDSSGAYRFRAKDTSTIDATVYFDDARMKPDLVRDIAEEPDRIYATAVAPDGRRVRFGAYPGLVQGERAPYPYKNHNRVFGEGTTNADTDTGDGISVMIWRLVSMGYLDLRDSPGAYDGDVTDAVHDLQDDAGIPRSKMNFRTWKALYDLSATGYSLRRSRILPAAERSSVRKWDRSSSGAVIARNRDYDSHKIPVDRNIDVGTGFTRHQVRGFAKAELRSEDNWVGTVNLGMALIHGKHTPGDPLSRSDVMPARAVRPGMNLWAPLYDGGTLFHVSGVTVSDDGNTVNAMIDTQFRDTIQAWQIIERNRESRHDPARQWIQQHRSSQNIKDSMVEWDDIGGAVDDTIHLRGKAWNVVPIIAGQEGTIARLHLNLNPDAEFVTAVFGRHIGHGKLFREVGNPLSKDGSKKWVDEGVRRRLDRDHILLYVAGDIEQPCGYFPKVKTPPKAKVTDDPSYSNAPNGRWEDDAGFPYRTFNQPVIYLAIYPDRDCRLPAGRVMWNQLEVGN